MQAIYDPFSNAAAINLVAIGPGEVKFCVNCNTFRKPWYCFLFLGFDQRHVLISIDVAMDAHRLLPINTYEIPISQEQIPPSVLLPNLVTVSYDEQTDMAYLWFWGKDSALLKASKYHCPKRKAKTDIFIHFDASNHLLGLEVHCASKFLPPEVLESVQKGHEKE